jgi:hypothetical protein
MDGTLVVEIHRGDAAFALIDRPEFQSAWRSLHHACRGLPHFQDRPFAATHRHRVSVDEAAFAREVRDNRERLRKLRESEPTHFCSPGGVHRREFLPWLRDCNVASATTCAPGLASRRDHPLRLPRYIDTADHTEAEFRGWLTGVPALLPRRRQARRPASSSKRPPRPDRRYERSTQTVFVSV